MANIENRIMVLVKISDPTNNLKPTVPAMVPQAAVVPRKIIAQPLNITSLSMETKAVF